MTFARASEYPSRRHTSPSCRRVRPHGSPTYFELSPAEPQMQKPRNGVVACLLTALFLLVVALLVAIGIELLGKSSFPGMGG